MTHQNLTNQRFLGLVLATMLLAAMLPVPGVGMPVFASPAVASATFHTQPMIAADVWHTVVLKSDGSVWAWGANSSGQLGDGSTTSQSSPVQVAGLSEVTAIAAGSGHTVALKSDGSVWAWGYNYYGQLGDGSRTEWGEGISYPVQVAGLSGVTAIATGYTHTVALKSDGSVWAWGFNGVGQLGDGSTTGKSTPVQVVGLSDVAAIAAGDDHTVALKSDGSVWAWGHNEYGQLGDGSTTNQYSPVQVAGLSDVAAISAGRGHTVALKSDGSVWAWGYNYYGQLGDGSTTGAREWISTPVQAAGLSDVVAIAAGYYHTVALKSDDSVWVWGANFSGQLGDGSTIYRLSPMQVAGISGVTAIAAGHAHTVVLKSDGSVWAWGRNIDGQLGDGSTTNQSSSVQVASLSDVVAIAAGNDHTVALELDGSVWAWGVNYHGQLGDGSRTEAGGGIFSPVQVTGLSDVAAIAAGNAHTVALKSDGSVWAWGSNSFGQLGDDARTEWNEGISSPVQVAGLSDVTAIAAGFAHTVALKSDGSVWAWGRNGVGQLGDGSTTGADEGTSSPVQVAGLSDVTAIAAGSSHTVALKSDGSVWAWGYNYYGQLGDGSTTNQSSPVQVAGLSDVTAIVASGEHTVALKSDGSVWAWGYNYYGQLGDGSTTTQYSPVQVAGLSDVAAIAAGGGHTVALKSDDSVWAWGRNIDGQLGNGATTKWGEGIYSPVQVTGLSDVRAVAAGYRHTIALKSDGSVWAWGANEYGQSALYVMHQATTPLQVISPNRAGRLSLIVPTHSAGEHTAACTKMGDATLNGVVDIDDILAVRAHMFGTKLLTGYALQAATVTNTVVIDIDVILAIRGDMFGIAPLPWECG